MVSGKKIQMPMKFKAGRKFFEIDHVMQGNLSSIISIDCTLKIPAAGGPRSLCSDGYSTSPKYGQRSSRPSGDEATTFKHGPYHKSDTFTHYSSNGSSTLWLNPGGNISSNVYFTRMSVAFISNGETSFSDY